MKIDQIMSKADRMRFADAINRETAEKMRDLDVGFLPVCDNEQSLLASRYRPRYHRTDTSLRAGTPTWPGERSHDAGNFLLL